MTTMDGAIVKHESPSSDTPLPKTRRKKSMVWDYFTTVTVNGHIKAICNQCNRAFAYISGSKLAGTSHLKRHITLGICPVKQNDRDEDQSNHSSPDTPLPSTTNISVNVTNRPRKRVRASTSVSNIYVEGDNCNNTFAKMVIQHDYPLHMAEQTHFVNLAKTLSPQFGITSVSLLEEQIMSIYLEEKRNLMDLVSRIPGHLSLTMDLWTSNQSSTYALLTAHFTDHDRRLQRRILNFIEVPFPDSDTAFSHAIDTCLTDWSSKGKVFTLTLNHCHVNDKARANIRSLLSLSPSILKGQLLINSCYARTLSGLAQEALNLMEGTVQKVRDSVKYVKTSKTHVDTGSKILQIDDLSKWNTTYQMLVAAYELQEVFFHLHTSDPDYKSNLSLEEWKQVKELCTYLRMFYDSANILNMPVYPTSNVFFNEAYKIQFELKHAALSQNPVVRDLTKPLLKLSTKYWEDCNLILAVAVVLDPRFKMKLLEWSFSRMYGDETGTWLKDVTDGLHELYLHYWVQSIELVTFLEGGDANGDDLSAADVGIAISDDGDVNLDLNMGDDFSFGEGHFQELDDYLQAPIMPRIQDFDVLGWWRGDGAKYKTLSKIAFDVLSIPLSTLPPESVFDTRESRVDSNRSSLRASTLEALVCAKDWLRYNSSSDSLQHFGTQVPKSEVKIEH